MINLVYIQYKMHRNFENSQHSFDVMFASLFFWPNLISYSCSLILVLFFQEFSLGKILPSYTVDTKRINHFSTYVCTECIFDIPQLVHNKIFLIKLIQQFVVHILTLLLAPFTLKLVHYSKHSESLNYVWKSIISCLRRKMSSISEFFRMFKDSLWRQ